jgi:tricorn protease
MDYFLSDRHLESLVPSPWGPRQPEPFFDKTAKIYLAALTKDQRSPFEPPDELHPAKEKKVEKKPEASSTEESNAAKKKEDPPATKEDSSTNKPVEVTIEFDGIERQVWEVPVPPGNYSDLSLNDKRLFWINHETTVEAKRHLQVVDITNEDPKPKTLAEDIKAYELSLDGRKLLIRKGDNFHVEDASVTAPAKLESIDLKNWTFSLHPREEWQQMFVEAWRLERDYFYDRKMHGVDWPAILKVFAVGGPRDRPRELSDLIGDMVSELAALHIRVVGGDHREGPDQIKPAALGAALVRDEARGGWRIERITRPIRITRTSFRPWLAREWACKRVT